MFKTKSVSGILWTVFGITALAFFIATTAWAANIFSDGFEGNSFAQWTKVDSGTTGMWRIDTARYEGRYSAHVIGSTGTTDDVLRKAISTDTFSTPTVSFSYKASGLDYKSSTKAGSVPEFDRFFAEYSTDGVNWTVLKEVNGKSSSELDGSWRQFSSPVPSHKAFQLRFRAKLSDSGDRVWIDNALIAGAPIESTLSRCTDRIDNDGDGYIDRDDPKCHAFYSDLVVVKDGTGEGFVESSPLGISCGLDCMERYLSNVMVTLTQTVGRGFVFAGWGGACAGFGDCEISMGTDREVTATFNALPPYTLTTANDAPDGGVIISEPAGIDCGTDCDEILYEGESVALTASPAVGYRFEQWSGDCYGASVLCELIVVSDLNATAHYTKIPTYILTVANSPTDGGSVISTPVGIACGADCAETVNEGTAFTLTATPAFGFTFSGWSGDCTGTESTCDVIMSADATAIANYEVIPGGICGNGVTEWDEECDDGNLSNGDWCSSTCQAPTLECSGTPTYPICRFVF